MKHTIPFLIGFLTTSWLLLAGDAPAREAEAAPPRHNTDRGSRDDRGRPPGPRRGGRGQGGGYSIEQAISDRAQLNTIAFDGLAFLTGDLGSCTFLPPGKAADFFGFQYMRDIDANELGHNTSFVPRAANNVLAALTAEQRAKLIALAREQEPVLAEFGYKRFPLIKAFCRQLAGELPAGATGLDRAAVMKFTGELFEIDGRLSYRRAEVLGDVIRSLTDTQRQALSQLAFTNSATWPERPDQVEKRSLPHAVHVAVMTYASEMLSWYAGSVDADVYFCPERHATYFGSFYMKDIPAMGNANYSISTSLTGDSGEAFLAALSDGQRGLVTGLVERQRADLKEIVDVRRAISVELRRFMKEPTVDQARVMSLARRYGELDGAISHAYAMHFTGVARTLSPAQKQVLLKLRNLDSQYVCKGAYLYSQAIPMPEIANTDAFFGTTATVPTASASSAATAVRDEPSLAPAKGSVPATKANTTDFMLTSPAVAEGGRLPVEFTGDGDGATLPLVWDNPPAGTSTFALIMDHLDPENLRKWYWTVYNIPGTNRALPRNATAVGSLGNNSVNGRQGYAPPHSKGPGDKPYTLTLYALSGRLELAQPSAEVDREALLAAMKDKVLGQAALNVVYARGEGTAAEAERTAATARTAASSVQGRRGPAGSAEGPRGQRPRQPLVEALDANHDGTISADELAAAVESLRKLDRNGDGQLTSDEYRPARPEDAGRPRNESEPAR